MLNVVRQFKPSTWEHDGTEVDLRSYSEEYQQIMYEVRQACTDYEDINPRRVIRVQDLYSYGQFMIREQLLINSNEEPLYRERRYLQVSRSYLSEIIKYNADPRRIGLGQNIIFSKRLGSFDRNQLIVVVKVLTTEPNKARFTPSTSCDYFVEYIIDLQN